MDIFQKLAEKQIKDAIDRGEFDDVPGMGQPLELEDDSNVPEDLRMAYKILKNASCLPPEVELRKEIRRAEDLLEAMTDEKSRYKQIKKMNFLIMKLNMLRPTPVNFEEHEVYFEKSAARLTLESEKKKG
ncbi:MAG: DUF1992 domain-containing protein [Deltaproteobacteria bacterium]|nr:DUF1992 domain-containing protein [Deltaproteobacteria bacterium]